MGRIIPPRKPVYYDDNEGTVTAQAYVVESGEKKEYARVLELVRWKDGSPRELRFSYYVREKGEGDEDWNNARRQVNMRPETLIELIQQAKLPQAGFGDSLKKIQVL